MVENETDRIATLITLSYRLEEWLKQGEGLLAVVRSLIPHQPVRFHATKEAMEAIDEAWQNDTRKTGQA